MSPALHDQNLTIGILWLTIWTFHSEKDPTRWRDLVLYVLFHIWSSNELIHSIFTPIRNELLGVSSLVAAIGLGLAVIVLSRSPRQTKHEQ
jgi:hypothetical protein